MDTSKLQHWSAERELESACSAVCKAEVTTAYKSKLILASQRPRHAPQGRQLDNLLCKAVTTTKTVTSSITPPHN